MAIVISVVNEKGGVAKTMTVNALGSFLSQMGKNVLMVDLDKQASLTSNFRVSNKSIDIYDVFIENKVAVEEVNKHLWIIPGTNKMAHIDRDIDHAFPHVVKQKILEKRLEPLQDKVDFILFDCPPDADRMQTYNALAMSDYVIIPTMPHPDSISGIDPIMDIINQMNEGELNEKLKVLGILITIFDKRTVLHKDMVSNIQDKYGDLVFESIIRSNIALQESTTIGLSMDSYDDWKTEQSTVKIKKESAAIMDYKLFTSEVLERLNSLK